MSRIRILVDEVQDGTVYATAYTDAEYPDFPTEVWEVAAGKFPDEHPPEPGFFYWVEEDGTLVRHEMHDHKWTQEDIAQIEEQAQEWLRMLSPASERMAKWVVDNCTPEGAKFVEMFQLDNPERAFVMLRHQVRDVAEHTGLTTRRLKELYRIALEEVADEPKHPNFPNMALQHLTNMNPYGISAKGEAPLTQCRDDREPEIVEWVYVGDLLEQLR